MPQQSASHDQFATSMGLDQRAPQHVRARFAQAQHARLGKSAGGSTTARTTEHPGVGFAVGHVHDEAVQAHQAHASIEGPRHGGRALQANHPLGQKPQHGHAQTLTCLAQRRTPPRAAPPKHLQPAIHLAVAVATEQPQGDHKPDHEPRGQTPTVASVLPRLPQERLHVAAADGTFQDPSGPRGLGDPA